MHDITIEVSVTSETLIKLLQQKGLEFNGLSISGNNLSFEGAITDEFPKNTLKVSYKPSVEAFYDYFFSVMLSSFRQSSNSEDYSREIEVVFEFQKSLVQICEDTTSIYLQFTDYFTEDGLGVYEEIYEDSHYSEDNPLNYYEYSGGSYSFELSFDKSNETKPWKLLGVEFELEEDN
jgi:hypothetical protein